MLLLWNFKVRGRCTVVVTMVKLSGKIQNLFFLPAHLLTPCMASMVCFWHDDCCEGRDGEPWKRLLIMHWLEGKGEIVNRTDSEIKLILGEVTQTGIWLIDNVWKHCEL